ncbi:unnamed protein product [Prorocentrum cordatum]|uniref:Uncharacterized protein n=1 Tax=Prorocentrum cordatum TaxID=2364126 RepID=A0ABN9V303_9DINO|nr:unnamed protein product [Polarella glacialis]
MPLDVTIDFADRFAGVFKLCCEGNARVIAMSAAELSGSPAVRKLSGKVDGDDHHVATVAAMKQALTNFMMDEAHLDKDKKSELVKNLGCVCHVGALDMRQALVVPPGWLVATAAPVGPTRFLGVSVPFLDPTACGFLRRLPPDLEILDKLPKVKGEGDVRMLADGGAEENRDDKPDAAEAKPDQKPEDEPQEPAGLDDEASPGAEGAAEKAEKSQAE